MKKTIVIVGVLMTLIVGVFGLPPFGGEPTSAYAEGEPGFRSEVHRLPNGVYEVSALTLMPGVTPDMIRWWFADYMQTTEHYQRWHPTAHIWMEWENKVPGEYVGASHLVHETIGEELAKLRIQFVPAQQILGNVELVESDVAVCALPGLLEESIYGGRMCHIVRKTAGGAEMRSRFWLGYIAKREGNAEVASVIGLIGNTYVARLLGVRKSDALALMRHAEEEMSELASFLPELYRVEHAAALTANRPGSTSSAARQ